MLGGVFRGAEIFPIDQFQDVHPVLAGGLHGGEGLAKEVRILRIEVVLPEVGAEPGVADLVLMLPATRTAEDAVLCKEVPTVAAGSRRAGAGMLGIRLPLLAVRHVDGPVEEGVVELAQVGDFHRPIVHLHVDVGMDVGVPSRRAAVVPDSLQVAWQGHSARRGNGKVTAIGKIELLEQQFVRFRAVVFDESIGRLALRSGIGKVQTHTVEESLIVCHMLAVDRCPPFLGGLVQTAAYGVCQVFGCGTTDVGRLRVVEIGGSGQIDHHLVGTADGDAARR